MNATVSGILLSGIHGSRPAASAVGVGTLYSCTTHSLIYQTDGSSWTTWATLGAVAVSLGSASYRRTTGDYTTTSSSFADIDGTNLALTVTTGARRALCVLQGSWSVSSAPTTVAFDILVDGSSLGGADGLQPYATNEANYRRPLMLAFITDALSAASHTFKAQYKTGLGTLTVYGGTGASQTPLKFSVVELPV